MPSSSLAPVKLSSDERAESDSWTRRRSSAQALALRSRIVVLAADERSRELGVHRNMSPSGARCFSRTASTVSPMSRGRRVRERAARAGRAGGREVVGDTLKDATALVDAERLLSYS
jgi:hypothetical protein